MKRTASAIWQGTGKEGKGTLSTGSGTLKSTPYNYVMRFEEAPGTNPEELIAAAHAGCFNMKLSFVLVAGGFTAESLNTTATVTLENGAITSSHLQLKAKVPQLDQAKFLEFVNDAKANCPVSKVLNAAVTVEAVLEG